MTQAIYVISPADEAGVMRALAFPSREAAMWGATVNDYLVGDAADVIFTGAVLVEIYNALTGKAVKKFETRDIGVRRLLDALPTVAKVAPAAPTQEKPVSDAQTQETPKRRGRAPDDRFNDAQVITVTAAENPKKAGSKTFEKFAKLATGMTVGDARGFGFSSHDLEWDRDHGFISIA